MAKIAKKPVKAGILSMKSKVKPNLRTIGGKKFKVAKGAGGDGGGGGGGDGGGGGGGA